MGASETTFTFNIKAVANMEDVVTNVKNIQNALNQLKLSPSLKESFKGTFKNLEKELERYQNLLSSGIKTKGQASALEKSGNNIIKLYDQIVKKINSINNADLKKAFEGIRTTEIEKMKQKLTELQNQLKTTISTKNLIDTTGAQDSLKKIRSELSKTKSEANKKMAQGISSMLNNGLATFTKNLSLGNLDAAEQALGRLEQKVKDLGNNDVSKVIDNLRNQFNQLKQDSDIKTITENLQNLKSSLSSSEATALQNLVNQFKNGSKEAQELAKSIEQVIQEKNKLGKNEASTNTEIESFKNRMKYTLGLANSFYLLRRAVKSAVSTIKELDKAMTETAVVTDMTISDMWAKLPEYTERANQLGVSTLEAYQAATLYYQQGLSDTQAAELSTETLKMARIAGLEAADATDRMTNALRGFNMELNAINAQKVDDVYSKLAAMSASNVDEISTAMTKVASLAHNANMDFETTAAFLAQIIETTRESAETAGTALKTVVARFTEVKKLVSEDQLKGQDEEGQVIDVNKVSQALRTAGIDLNKYFTGEVGLDDIFMELASKWDSLTSIQQRYIATQAAGSRQQSRFIAMMQDYARTQELVSAAYNANGASAKQFEKTQDSLQSKLARLKNAWDEFLMGITNSSFIKFLVVALTDILKLINNLTGALGSFLGGFAKLGVAIAVVRTLRKAFESLAATKILGGIDKLLGGAGLSKSTSKEGSTEKTAGITFLAKVREAAQEFLAKIRQAAAESRQSAAAINTENATENTAENAEDTLTHTQNNAQDTLTTQANNAAEIATQTKKSAMELATAEAANRRRLGGSFLPMLGGRSPTPLLGNGSSTPIPLGNGWSVLPASGTSGPVINNASGVAAGSFLGQMGTKISGFITKHPIAIAVAALGLEIYGTVKLIQAYNQRYKKRLEKAEKTSKNIQAQSKRIQEQQLKAQEVQKNYSDYTEKVDTAKTVSQRSEAIKDRNDYITSLLEENAAYAKYVHTTFENGEIILTLDSDALAAAVDKIAEGALRAKAYASGAEAVTAVARQQYYEDQFADKGNWTLYGGLIGEALFGWLGPWGAMLGAILGTTANTREVDYEKTREDFDTDQEYAAYLRNRQSAENAQEQRRAYIEQAAANFVSAENVDDNTSELIAKYFGKYFDTDEIQDAIQTIIATEWTDSQGFPSPPSRNELEESYYQYYGVEVDPDMEDKDLQNAVLQAKALEMTLGVDVTNLANLLTGENGKVYSKVLSAALGMGEMENIDLSGVNLDAEDAIIKLYGDDFVDQAKALATAMGLDENAILDQVREQLRLNKEIQRATKQRIVQNSQKTGYNLTQEQATWIGNLAPDEARQLEAITSKASELLTGEQYGELLSELQSESGGLDWDETQEFFDNIDLDNPIQALLRLQKVAKSGSEAMQNLAQSIIDTNSEAFSASALTQDFLNSEGYEQLNEALSEFIEQNGEISSSNIVELAKSNSKLNDLLKTGVITTKALAIALTGIENGTIAVTDLTSSVITALNGMDDLDGAVQRTIDNLNNFDPGYDEADVVNFIKKVFEYSQEQIESGAYGSNQMRNYMQYIFGEFDPNKEKYTRMSYSEAYQSWLQEGLTWLEANQDNMYSAWHDLVVKPVNDNLLEGVRLWEENGEIFIDAAGHTTDELVSILSKAYGLTEEQVSLMITDFKRNSLDFAHMMDENDLPSAVAKWAESLPQSMSEIFVLDRDLETLANLLGVKTDDIVAILEESGKKVNKLHWGEGATEDIANILNTLSGRNDYKLDDNGKWQYTGQRYDSTLDTWYMSNDDGLIDYDQLKQGMRDAGLPEYFEQTLNEMVGEGEDFVAEIDGQLQTIHVDAGETASEAYQQEVEKAAQENFATMIGTAVAEQLANIDVKVNTENAQQQLNTLLNLIPEQESIKIVLDTAKAIGQILSLRQQAQTPIPVSTEGSSDAKGGIVGSYASGVSNRKLSPGISLTGEEAPEIVWNKEKGYAYITGAHGPQFQNLRPGDQVFNGQETKKILNNTGRRENLFGSYVNGKKKPTTSTWFIQDEGSGKKVTIEDRTTQASAYGKETLTGPGSGNNNNNNNNKNNDDWKNDLDWLYDLMEDIAEEEHRQSLIQEEYELSLKDLNKTGKDLYDLTRQELSSLMTQLDAQQFAYEKRLQQMNELQAEVNEKGYQEYVQWNPNDQTLEIDWDKIEDLTDKDTYEAIKGLLSEMEKVQDQMDDAEKSIWDIKKQIQEIQTRYLEKYLDFQQKVLDAVVKNYQDNIDKLNSLNDTIKEANDSILNSIQKEIDLQRQIRDNTKTESDIYDMETRLAYLLRDTSGANQKEIQDLQKQLKESRENYADALIDQSIKRLQDSNSDAVDQREQQIKLLEAQLEYWQETGALWAEVAQLIVDGFTSSGSIIEGSALWEFLKRADSWDGLSEAQKKNWANELILEANEVGAHLIQLSGGIDIDTDKVINSIADINGILTEDISVKLEQVRAILAEIGTLGGTPEHSNHEGYGYSTGGLNTHPGMAMLHGTSTEPEYVLNARQTGAFLRLADVLPSIFGSGTGATNNYGTNVYVELNMSVGEIGSDYDVDRLVARVKDDIYDASSYRNVNAVSFLR